MISLQVSCNFFWRKHLGTCVCLLMAHYNRVEEMFNSFKASWVKNNSYLQIHRSIERGKRWIEFWLSKIEVRPCRLPSNKVKGSVYFGYVRANLSVRDRLIFMDLFPSTVCAVVFHSMSLRFWSYLKMTCWSSEHILFVFLLWDLSNGVFSRLIFKLRLNWIHWKQM